MRRKIKILVASTTTIFFAMTLVDSISWHREKQALSDIDYMIQGKEIHEALSLLQENKTSFRILEIRHSVGENYVIEIKSSYLGTITYLLTSGNRGVSGLCLIVVENNIVRGLVPVL